jgi:hypothetical protein
VSEPRGQLLVLRLADDPLASAGDPDLIAIREDFGERLEAAVEKATASGVSADDLSGDADIIACSADKAIFGETSDGEAVLTAMARVLAVLATCPRGIDFAGRHWCAAHDTRCCVTEAAAAGAVCSDLGTRYLRKKTGSFYTNPELVDRLLQTTLLPQILEALTADGGVRDAPLVSSGNGTRYTAPRIMPGTPEEAFQELTVCDPACGAGIFPLRAARLIAWHLAMFRAGHDRSIEEELPRARRDVITELIHAVDLNPLTVDLTRLVLAAEAYVPGLPSPYLGHHVKCGNALIGSTPALLAKGIPDKAYTVIGGDRRELVTAARRKNKAERQAMLNGLPAAMDAPARMDEARACALAAPTPAIAHRILEDAAPVRLAKRVADAWCAAFMWPHDGNAEPVTTGTLLHIAAGGQLSPEAEAVLADLKRQHQFFHWHLEFPGIFKALACGRDGEAA